MNAVAEDPRQVRVLGGLQWQELVKRAFHSVIQTNSLSYAAALAYYFLFSLFPFILFLTALLAYLPLDNLLNEIMLMLGRVLPGQAHELVSDYINDLVSQPRTGLLSFGIVVAVWTASSAMAAMSDALNHAYEVPERRPFWQVRAVAMALTLALTLFMIASIVLLIFGPQIGAYLANWAGLGELFEVTWNILRWPVILTLVATAIAVIYYYAPDVDQGWQWITPGSVFAVLSWTVVSLGFSFYVNNFGSYNKTYGSIGAIIVLLTWMYASGFVILVGGIINAEIDHAKSEAQALIERRVILTLRN